MRTPETIIIGSQKIIYLNFSGLKKKEEVVEQIDYFGHYIRKSFPKSLVTITNLEDMYFNTDIFNLFVNYVKGNNPYVKSSAVIGMRGMMQIFYKTFIKLTGRNVIVCNTKEEAVAALAQNESVLV
ncbi:MAG: hypothetical protein PF436_06780 [Prolixibacteraceae bacterium]|jgi:hypothetical protein|nr:hypothetical protein [Prolixibacteraceae bacterium]